MLNGVHVCPVCRHSLIAGSRVCPACKRMTGHMTLVLPGAAIEHGTVTEYEPAIEFPVPSVAGLVLQALVYAAILVVTFILMFRLTVFL
jgi:hypothetical protein